MKPWEEYQKKPWEEYSAPPAEPPEGEPTRLDYAHDVGTAAGRVVTETADFPSTIVGGVGSALEMAQKKGLYPSPDDDSQGQPSMSFASVFPQALKAIGEKIRPSNLLGQNLKKKITERNVTEEQAPNFTRAIKFGETAAGALRHPTKLKTMIDDVFAGSGAVAGGELGKLSKNPYGEDLGTVIGALTGGAAGGAMAGLGGRPLRHANEFLDEISDDGIPSLLRQVEGRPPGVVGSLADAAPENLGVRAGENFAYRNVPDTRRALDDIQQQRSDQIVQQTGDIVAPPGATPAAARAQAADSLSAGEAAAGRVEDNALTQALRAEDAGAIRANAPSAQATEVADATDIAAIQAQIASREAQDALSAGISDTVSGMPSPATASRRAKEAVDTGMGGAKAVASEVWDAVDAGEKIPTATMKTALKDFVNAEFPSGTLRRAAFDKTNKEYIDTILKLDPAGVDPKDITWLISQTKSAIEEATPVGKSPTFMTNKLRELSKVVEQSVEKGSEAYTEARRLTKDAFDRYEIQDLKADPETFLTPARIAGQEGAVTANKLMAMKDITARRAAEDYVLSLAKKITDEGGDIRKFLDKNSEFISRLPRLRKLSEDARVARTGVDTTERALKKTLETQKATRSKATAEGHVRDRAVSGLAKARKKAEGVAKDERDATTGRLSKTVTGRYAQNGDVDKLVKDWLTKPGNVDDFKAATKHFDDRALGDSFRSDVKQKLIKQLMPLDAGKPRPTTNSISKWIETRPQLVKAGVLTEADASKIDDILDRTRTENLRKSIQQSAGPNVSQTIGDLESSAMASVTSSVLPISGHRLLMGNALKRAFTKFGIRPDPDPKTMAELHKVFTNPDELANFAKRYKDLDEVTEAIYRKMLAIEQATGENQEEEQ
jgi:hypothetical protein